MRIPAWLLCAFSAAGQAAPLHLACQGEGSQYQNGFGNPVVRYKETRIISVDVATNTVRADTFFGSKVGALAKWSNDRTFGFDIPIGESVGGRHIVSEWGHIDRFTGEVRTTYKVEPNDPGSMGYNSFTGQCKKTEQQF